MLATDFVSCDFCTATVAKEFWDAEWGTAHDGERLCPDCVEGGNWRECQACGFYDQRRRGDYCQACEEAAAEPDRFEIRNRPRRDLFAAAETRGDV